MNQNRPRRQNIYDPDKDFTHYSSLTLLLDLETFFKHCIPFTQWHTVGELLTRLGKEERDMLQTSDAEQTD